MHSRAAAAALLIIGVAGELAGEQAEGPGSFAFAIIDALHNLDAADARRTCKGDLMAVDLRLYALVDPAVAGGRTLADLARRLRRRARRWCNCATSMARRAP